MKTLEGGRGMGIMNCTPHDITIYLNKEKIITIPASGYLIRISTESEQAGFLNYKGYKIPVVKQQLKNLKVTTKEGRELNEREIKELFEGVEAVIVPTIVGGYKQQLFELIGKEIQLYAPNTAKAVRDNTGKILGVTELVAL